MELRLQDDAWNDVDEGTEGLLDSWLVKEGDRVTAGQVIASVFVAKTAFDLVAPVDGRIAKLLVGEQDNFGSQAVLAELEET